MPPVQASRVNTLDGILDELPDFSDGYFGYPVDDFFPEYVERLGQGAQEPAQTGQQNGLMQLTDGMPSNNGFPANTTQPLRSAPQQAAAMDLGPYDMQEPAVFLPQPTSQAGANGVNSSNQYNSAFMQMPQIGPGPPQPYEPMNSEESGSGQGSGADLGKTTSRGRATRGRASLDYQVDSGDDSEEEEPHKRGSRPLGKAKRNAKQQAQNKQAQQRYRERRKQRFNDMEHAIEDLNARLQQMQTIKSQNALLMAKSHELSSMLEAKNEEINRLKGQVGDPNTEEESYEQRRRADEALLSDMQGQAVRNVQEMKAFIERYGLLDADPTGAGVDPQIVQQIAEIVGRQCASINTNLRPDSVNLMRLMSADVHQMGLCTRKSETLSKGLQNLKLSDQQKQQLLLLRSNHLNNLKEIYVERQQLNTQAMAFMLPSGQNQSTQSLESKLERMRHASYRRMAAQSVNLDEILSSIKDNLRKEQRRVMELNFVTLHRTLSPIQAAIYVVGIFPMSFDALELANYLAVEAEGNASGQSETSNFESGTNGNSTEQQTDANSLAPLLYA